MSNGIYEIPYPINEPILSYAPGSLEREKLQAALKEAKSNTSELPMRIGGKKITTDNKVAVHPPHEHKHVLGYMHYGNKQHVNDAIQAALAAKEDWANMAWQDRAAIFLKAADLLASDEFRFKMNAATMLGQSKNAFQAEIDAACEFIDFLRFNVQFMTEIYDEQPYSPNDTWNRMEYRPLEGFIFALTPFNFTAIAGNLSASPALMGNTIVWKPSNTQAYAAQVIMELFEAAGLPDGVINLIYGDGPEIGEVVFSHPEFAGLHFTGSTNTFQYMWKTIGNNIGQYKQYPRIVGETGGKDFVLAHPSTDPEVVAVALLRGAFEYQGQKCSAASRAYLPESLWPAIKERLLSDMESLKMGSVEDFSNFINAVIDEKSFDKIAAYIDQAKEDSASEVIAGGGYDKSTGYFIEPTVIKVQDPKYCTMCEEIFGPVLTIYVYQDDDFDEVLELVDSTSPYALTGAIFARPRSVISKATKALSQAAGNFYINDKPTGAVVNQQPFGGARASGTNDKAGSKWNLIRWVSPRAIKENMVPPRDYRYPFLGESGEA